MIGQSFTLTVGNSISVVDCVFCWTEQPILTGFIDYEWDKKNTRFVKTEIDHLNLKVKTKTRVVTIWIKIVNNSYINKNYFLKTINYELLV